MRFWYWRRRPEVVRDEVDEELRVHLEMRIDELRAAGLSPEEARRQAVRQFGDLEGTRRYCRRQDLDKENRVQRLLFLQDLAQDLTIGLRNLLRVPGLALTVVVTVGLGIGATTAIFAAVNAALLQPLPYKDPDRLVRIYTDAPPYRFPFSVADYLALEAQQTRFEQIAGYRGRAMAFSDGTVAERLTGREVSWTYFRLLGIAPAIGRDFTEQDGRPGNPRAAVISHGLWERRLGSRPGVVGQPIRLDGADYTIAGILPPQLGPFERRQDFFIAAQWSTPRRKGPFFITALGRLRDGAGPAAAASELHTINRRLFPLWKSSYQDDRATWNLMDLKAFVAGDIRTVAGVALAAVALVWLIATANAANLLVARVTSRRRELAVRAALGASRGRVVRYLLAESALLAIGAAAVGLSIAWGGIRLLQTAGANYLPRTQEIGLDGPVLWLLAAVTIASGVLFGAVPALYGAGGPVEESLRSMGRSATGSRAVRRLRRGLVASQFAIATPLLVGAGLLLVSLNELRRVDLGFDTRNMLTGAIQLPAAQYPENASIVFWDELKRRVAALPGVSAVAFADGRPPDDVSDFNNFDLEDQPTPPGQSQPVTPWVGVTPEYFGVLGLPLLEGRLLDERDMRAEDLEAVVVDRAWAKRFFPNESAIGKRLRSGGCTQCPWTTVVGVVSEVKYAGLDQPGRRHRVQGAGAGLFVRIHRRANGVGSADGPARRPSGGPRSRPDAAVLRYGNDGGDGGAIARTAAVAVHARGRVRDRRPVAVDDRHLRRDGVLRPAAHQGHQHSPRARRQSRRCASPRPWAGHAGGRDRRGRGSRGRVRGDPVDVDGAVRRRRDRRRDVWRRRRVPAGRGAARVRRSGEARHWAAAGEGAAQ